MSQTQTCKNTLLFNPPIPLAHPMDPPDDNFAANETFGPVRPQTCYRKENFRVISL